jgi:hypothetical protein
MRALKKDGKGDSQSLSLLQRLSKEHLVNAPILGSTPTNHILGLSPPAGLTVYFEQELAGQAWKEDKPAGAAPSAQDVLAGEDLLQGSEPVVEDMVGSWQAQTSFDDLYDLNFAEDLMQSSPALQGIWTRFSCVY